MNISELIVSLDNQYDVTTISSIEGYILFYQNDSFNIALFNREYLPKFLDTKKSFYELFPGTVKKIEEDKIYELLYTGMMIIYDEMKNEYYMFDLISRDTRKTSDSLEEPEAITGPRDGFVENIKTNICLIRQRIKDNSLRIEEKTLGRRSKTKINILSISDVTNESFIKEVKYHLDKIDTDAILSIEDITTVFQKNCIMLQYLYVGVPDIASRRLLDGEIIILIDNIPSAICLPNTISSFLRNRVEQVNIPMYSLFERFFLYLSIFIAVFFLPIMTCFLTYQSDSLSLSMLLRIKVTEEEVFFPIYIEMFFVLFLFELYYIVSFKSPKLTLSSMVVLVGGIIIGQNTIESGMVSVFVMTCVALCFLATFTISSNITFVMSLSLLRIMLLVSTIFLGMFGFTISAFYLICKIAEESTFHIDFLYPFIPFDKKGIRKVVLFDSSKSLVERPIPLNVKNRRKKK